MKNQSLHEDSLSRKVQENLLTIFGNFKENKLSVEKLTFEDKEVEQAVHAIPKLSKKQFKNTKAQLQAFM